MVPTLWPELNNYPKKQYSCNPLISMTMIKEIIIFKTMCHPLYIACELKPFFVLPQCQPELIMIQPLESRAPA